ncbi:serine/threonine protein kinase [Saprolegnia diclina VS20]|uniref:Serine/threonine protein kinase n=1 Tax=Saprolegnia diclina (strain VS20) TaxID=1156394 RepID=T0PXR2_SAPDV|nr:serine/threonine protein kinase [Saprolegnia diclina VS20]EQC27021.1 serine/threonine protein kinase [Saprolegnia diclina VS20]|eukprot:XP_008619521.1 serine/threonine protein kinase [Saprolegnia diclina VS20]
MMATKFGKCLIGKTGRTALHKAAAKDHGEVVARLVAAGATIDVAARTNGWTALLVATAKQHVGIVDQLLRASASVNVDANVKERTKTLCQPLHLAAKYGNVALVDLFVAHKANVDAGSMRPLHVAIENDRIDVVQRLLDADASLSVTNLAGKTPRMLAKALQRTVILHRLTRHALFRAVRDHNVDGFTKLLDVDVDGMCNNAGAPLLHVLVERNSTEMLQAVLAKSLKSINVEHENQTPLDRAIANKSATMALALVLANAEWKHLPEATVAAFVRSPDAFMFSAQLLRAASSGDTGVVAKLLAMGVRATATDETLRTALHVAATHGEEAMAVLLLEKNALLCRCRDHKGNLPLHNAAANGHIALLDHLVAPTAARTIDEANDDGWTPVALAVQSGHTNVVARLLHHGASLEHKRLDGTLLHVATSRRVGTDLLKHLVTSGSKVEACDTRGWTPLHVAAHEGHIQAVEYLVRVGANVVAETLDRETPLQIANDKKVVKALRTAQADARNRALARAQEAAAQAKALCDAVPKNDVGAVTDLLAAGVDPSGLTVEGVALPVVAMRLGHWETCDRLLAVSVVTSDAARVRMLHSLALELEQFEAAWHILQAYADVLACDKHVLAEDDTPVHDLQAMWTGAALRTAARKGQIDVAKRLLSQFQGIVDATNERGETPLYVAIDPTNESSDVAARTAMATLLLGDGANPLAITTAGVTPLLLAARSGNSDITAGIVKAVLAQPSPDMAALSTCFAEAVGQRDMRVATVLLPHMTTDDWTSTLASDPIGMAILAATAGHLGILEHLQEKHYDLFWVAHGAEGSTLLMLAAAKGHAKLVDHLVTLLLPSFEPIDKARDALQAREKELEAARDHVCLRNTAGQTAKDLATGAVLTEFLENIAAELELVRQLIQEARLVEAADAHDWLLVMTLLNQGVAVTDACVVETIWRAAVGANDKELITTLFRATGIDASLRKEAGRAALKETMNKETHNWTMVSSILQAFAATNGGVAPEALLPWHIAAECASSAVLGMMFFPLGHCINSTDADGLTPVAVAIQSKNREAVETLIAFEADISIAPPNKDPPLHMALSLPESLNVLRVVLRAKRVNRLNVEQRNTANYTALMRAVVDGREEAVELLLEAGANVMQTLPDNGPTILAAAAQRPNRAITKLMDDKVYEVLSKTWAATINFGDVQLDAVLGEGASGLVRRATYKNDEVAVKTCKNTIPRVIKAFREEIETTRRLRSPYLVRLLTVLDDANGKPHMVLELMDAGDLYKYIENKRHGTFVTKDFPVVQVAWAVANALADIHAAECIHRDVKSKNVFLCTTNGVKLGDFGTLRSVDETMTSNVGTPQTMAPEVTRRGDEGECAYDTSADMYSFGVVLAELTWIRTPYDSSTEDICGHGNVTATIQPHCAMWFKTLATRCLAVDPTERPSAAHVVEILAAHLEDKDDHVVPTPPPEPTPHEKHI